MQPVDPTPADDLQGHEPDTFDVRRVIVGFLGLALLVPLTMALAAELESRLTDRGPAGDSTSPSRSKPATGLAGGKAQLNADLPAVLKKLRASERQTLDSYGWVDRDGGIARIPIERAIELLSNDQSLLAPADAPDQPREQPGGQP